MKNYLNSIEKKRVLITGASSGIGKSIAHSLADEGCEVLVVARRENVLQELQLKHSNLQYLSGDLNDSQFLDKMEKEGFFNVDILINNAGLALGKDLFEESKEEDIDLVLQTNISSAFKVARRSLKNMKTKREGDIVNICSIASHESYTGGVVYCASKHALLSMGKALRQETHGQNIRIISISPGMVETEFSRVRFKGDEEKAKKTYEGFSPLKAEDVAYQIYQALRCPRHVNLDEIIILASDQAGATKVARNLPTSIT